MAYTKEEDCISGCTGVSCSKIQTISAKGPTRLLSKLCLGLFTQISGAFHPRIEIPQTIAPQDVRMYPHPNSTYPGTQLEVMIFDKILDEWTSEGHRTEPSRDTPCVKSYKLDEYANTHVTALIIISQFLFFIRTTIKDNLLRMRCT